LSDVALAKSEARRATADPPSTIHDPLMRKTEPFSNFDSIPGLRHGAAGGTLEP